MALAGDTFFCLESLFLVTLMGTGEGESDLGLVLIRNEEVSSLCVTGDLAVPLGLLIRTTLAGDTFFCLERLLLVTLMGTGEGESDLWLVLIRNEEVSSLCVTGDLAVPLGLLIRTTLALAGDTFFCLERLLLVTLMGTGDGESDLGLVLIRNEEVSSLCVIGDLTVPLELLIRTTLVGDTFFCLERLLLVTLMGTGEAESDLGLVLIRNEEVSSLCVTGDLAVPLGLLIRTTLAGDEVDFLLTPLFSSSFGLCTSVSGGVGSGIKRGEISGDTRGSRLFIFVGLRPRWLRGLLTPLGEVWEVGGVRNILGEKWSSGLCGV